MVEIEVTEETAELLAINQADCFLTRPVFGFLREFSARYNETFIGVFRGHDPELFSNDRNADFLRVPMLALNGGGAAVFCQSKIDPAHPAVIGICLHLNYLV
jgi:hypothetical protein